MPAALRATLNWVTLGTPLGLLLALAGRCRFERGPAGTLLARDFRLPFPGPGAPAFTVGDVILLRIDDAALARRRHLLGHEVRHCEQYARCLGPLVFVPAYLVACAVSWWVSGSPALRNVFERDAGLVEGGYLRPWPGWQPRDQVSESRPSTTTMPS